MIQSCNFCICPNYFYVTYSLLPVTVFWSKSIFHKYWVVWKYSLTFKRRGLHFACLISIWQIMTQCSMKIGSVKSQRKQWEEFDGVGGRTKPSVVINTSAVKQLSNISPPYPVYWATYYLALLNRFFVIPTLYLLCTNCMVKLPQFSNSDKSIN